MGAEAKWPSRNHQSKRLGNLCLGMIWPLVYWRRGQKNAWLLARLVDSHALSSWLAGMDHLWLKSTDPCYTTQGQTRWHMEFLSALSVTGTISDLWCCTGSSFLPIRAAGGLPLTSSQAGNMDSKIYQCLPTSVPSLYCEWEKEQLQRPKRTRHGDLCQTSFFISPAPCTVTEGCINPTSLETARFRCKNRDFLPVIFHRRSYVLAPTLQIKMRMFKRHFVQCWSSLLSLRFKIHTAQNQILTFQWHHSHLF